MSKLTLALGGGGARGVSHLGVIEILLEAEFEIERLVGVSSGSLASALYAFNDDITGVQTKTMQYLMSASFQRHQEVLFGAAPAEGSEDAGGMFSWYDRVKSYLRANSLFHRVLRHPGLLPGIVLHDVVDHLLPDADISEASVPLTIVAIDLLTGHPVLLEKGSVRDAVRASCSLPGIFPPVEFEGMLLCDIGTFFSLPTTLASSYAPECLVAVEVNSALKTVPTCESALDVLIRMGELAENMFRKKVRDAADLIIEPKVAGIEWFDFSNADKAIEAGRQAARKSISQLRQLWG
ncbi:MAG: patatin [Planctomycetaceae bacterium]|nr:patatin [Planctomycetaceae bacterium]